MGARAVLGDGCSNGSAGRVDSTCTYHTLYLYLYHGIGDPRRCFKTSMDAVENGAVRDASVRHSNTKNTYLNNAQRGLPSTLLASPSVQVASPPLMHCPLLAAPHAHAPGRMLHAHARSVLYAPVHPTPQRLRWNCRSLTSASDHAARVSTAMQL